MRKIHIILTLALFTVAGATSALRAQAADGKWSLGIYAGGNMWVSDYNQQKFGPGAMIDLRYNATPLFSIGLRGGWEELKTGNSFTNTDFPYSYLKMNAFPVSLVARLAFTSNRNFQPYAFAGGGTMFYKRETANKIPVPDDKLHGTLVIPFGLGFEAAIGRSTSLGFEVGASHLDDNMDLRTNSSPEGFLTAKVGLVFALGGGDSNDDDNDGLTNGQERRLGTNPSNLDTDGDGLTDGDEVKVYRTNPLRTDTDGDGLSDGDEVLKHKTDPTRFDSEGDGLADGDEVQKHGTDPARPDTDGDGMTDGEEVLRFKTNPLKVDTDGDGVSDFDEVKKYRSDPNSADSDGDGVPDGEEVLKYRTDPLKVDSDGGGMIDGAEVIRGTNPLDPADDVVREAMVLEKGRSFVLDGVNFESGSANLTVNSETLLLRAYNALVTNPTAAVEIAGYTDNVGSKVTNQKLSQRRAEAVKSWLVGKGIAPGRLTAKGYGIANPIDNNRTPEGRARNRRIEFHVR